MTTKTVVEHIEDGPYFMISLGHSNKVCLPIKEGSAFLELLDQAIHADYDYTSRLHKYKMSGENIDITYTSGAKIREEILEASLLGEKP